jgi:hypothetical protein
MRIRLAQPELPASLFVARHPQRGITAYGARVLERSDDQGRRRSPSTPSPHRRRQSRAATLARSRCSGNRPLRRCRPHTRRASNPCEPGFYAESHFGLRQRVAGSLRTSVAAGCCCWTYSLSRALSSSCALPAVRRVGNAKRVVACKSSTARGVPTSIVPARKPACLRAPRGPRPCLSGSTLSRGSRDVRPYWSALPAASLTRLRLECGPSANTGARTPLRSTHTTVCVSGVLRRARCFGPCWRTKLRPK